MKLIGVSGALAGNKTAQMVYDVLNAAKTMNINIDIELIDLKEYDIEFMRGFPLSYYNEDTVKAVKKILNADAIIIGTPVYQASISGSLKNLFDHLPEKALQSKAAGYISTAGSDKYFLVAEYHLRPILQFFGANIAAKNVFVHDDSFDDESVIIDDNIKLRIRKLAEEILNLASNNSAN